MKQFKKTWTNTIIFDKEMLTQMINNLESEKSEYFMACINNSVVEIAKGELYKNLSEIEANNYLSKKPDLEPVHLIEEESENNDEKTEESTIESSNEVIDSELPNTELTEEDLKWEEEHK